jgi:hypothetical protein
MRGLLDGAKEAEEVVTPGERIREQMTPSRAIRAAAEYAKYIALPEDNQERVDFELGHWVGGNNIVCQWQLSVLTGRDFWSMSRAGDWKAYKAPLLDFCRARLPKASCDAIARLSGDQFARIYLEDLRRRTGCTIFGPLKKPDRAVILLLENPDLTDEQVAKRVPTTLKQLARFSTYTYLRREMRLAKEGIGG